jgi:hypothetical protein
MTTVDPVMVSDDVALPPKYLACRTLGHAWDRIESITWIPPFGIPLTLVCLRCGSERRDCVGRSGQLLYRRMVYAPGYLLTKGVRRPRRDDYRLHLMHVALNDIAMRRRRSNGG